MKINIGDKFGRLTVVKKTIIETGTRPRSAFECRCDCGGVSLTRTEGLLIGKAKSCGCIQKEGMSRRQTKHGEYRTPLYHIRSSMIARCNNPNHRAYTLYGGRGITVCEEWVNSFTVFRDWAVNNGYERGLDIDREDNQAGYSPGNCRWIARIANNRNRRNSVWVEAFGERKTIDDWAQDSRCLVTRSGLARRILRGWEAKDAISIPPYVTRSGECSVNNPYKRALKCSIELNACPITDPITGNDPS